METNHPQEPEDANNVDSTAADASKLAQSLMPNAEFLKIDNIKKEYFTYDGRISRFHFWKCLVPIILASIVLSILAGILAAISSFLGMIVMPFSLALSIMAIGPWIKRLHDRNKPGIMILVSFIPILGFLYLIYECGIQESENENNKYGEAPIA